VYGTLGIPAAGNNPGSRTGASTWTDADGNRWLFGGFGFDATGARGYLNDLWEFKHSLKQWVWMGGSSTIGSNGGQLGVYGALGTPAAGNMPGSRTGASSWTDRSGHLWLFGGGSFSDNTLYYYWWYLNDLWEFFPDRNQWAWMGGNSYNNPAHFFPIISDSCDIFGDCGWSGEYGSLGMPAAGNNPGSRSGASSWTDDTGNLWLFGGIGFAGNKDSYGPLNDLWEFNPATQEWTWISGSDTMLFEFSGQPGVYGTLGSPSVANTPGSRIGTSTWTDRIGHLWLYGGFGSDSNGTAGALNDLWVFDPSTDEWAWMSGSSTTVCLSQNYGNCGQPGIYGMLGTPAAGNVPGGRSGASSWIDNRGNLWLFGGYGYDANGLPDNLNDLWEYEPSHRCDLEKENRHDCYDERDPRRHHWRGRQGLDDSDDTTQVPPE
jgi:N-acetylneuraminic acid mutarotase